MTQRRRQRTEQTAVVRTFLIADIRGYTRFTNQLGDEAASRLAAKFAEVAAEGVEAYDGTLVELRGDEALAVFDSPRAALRAAAELQSAFGAETALEPHLPLTVGIGVDAGEAVPVGDGYRGAALNLAARLCATAPAGEIRVSATVVHLAGSIDGLAFDPLDSMELKGIGGAISPFAVRWGGDDGEATLPPPPTAPPPALPAELDSVVPFAGREQELRRLQWHWRRTRHGRPRIVVVTGPEGIGKTRLAGALAESVRRDGRTVVYRAATTVAELGELGPMSDPSLIVLDDMDRASAAVTDALWRDRLARVGTSGMTLVLARRLDDAWTAGLGAVDRLELDRLDAEGVRQIAAIYADESIDEVPLHLIEMESDGLPGAVHRVASQWARNHAVRRLGDSAERTASGRRELRSAEEALIHDVGGLERTRERARLYVVDTDVDEDRQVDICPYKGLATFEAADARYFFGRDRLVAELVARLVGSPFVAVIGASGSGKSSVLRAGLLPALADGVLPTSASWVQVVLRPGSHPLAELEDALREVSGEGRSERPIDEVLGRLSSDQRLLVVVDQFEELFSAPDDDERQLFIELLTTPRPGLKVIVALRSDHYGVAAAYPALARAIGADQVLVGSVTTEELEAIAERPAQSVGLRVEPELTRALVADAGQEPGALPLLSTALLELWQARTGRTLTLAAYRAHGGLRGAVARLAEAAYGRLSPEQQTRVRGVFLRLAGPGEGDVLVRRRVPMAEFDVETDAVTGEAIASLTQHRLLSVGDGYVEVAHEALLREWPRLRTWLEDDAAGRALRLHLIGAARDWDERGREPGDLYRGARLAAVLEWTAEHDPELNATERAFVEESRRLAELDAERERHTNRRLRLLLAGAGIFLIVSVLAGGFAVLQRQEAVAEASRADAEAERAVQQEEAAERAETIARSRELAAAAVSYMDDDPSLGKLLALAGASISDPPIETLASLHAAWAQDRVVARHSWGDRPIGELRPALSPDGRLLAMGGWDSHELDVMDPVSGEIVWSFATESIDYKLSPPYFTSDGTRLVASVRYLPEGEDPAPAPPPGRAGIYVWDAEDGRLIHVHDAGTCGAGLLALGNDVAMLATMRHEAPCWDYADPGQELLDIVTGERTLLTEVGGEAAVSADDSVAAYDDLAGDGFVSVVVDVETGAELMRIEPRLTGSTPDYFTRALNSDGSLLVYGDRPIQVWDVQAAEEIGVFDGHAGMTSAATFGVNGESVFSTGRDGSLREWDARSLSEIAEYRGFGNGSVAVAPARAVVAHTEGGAQAARVIDLRLRGEAGQIETCRGFVPAGNLEVVDGMASLAIHECSPAEAGGSVIADLADETVLAHVGGLAAVQMQAMSPDGTRLARQEGSLTRFGPLAIRDIESGKLLLELEGSCEWDSAYVPPEPGLPPPGCEAAPTQPFALNVWDLGWSPDGTRVALANHAGAGGGLMLWDATDGRLLHAWADLSASSVTFTPDGKELLAALWGSDEEVRVLRIAVDAGTVDEQFQLEGVPGLLFVGWSPDGSILYAVPYDQPFTRLVALNPEDLTVIRRVDYEGEVKSFALSPDGSRVAIGSVDGFVRVWDAATFALVHEIPIGDVEVNGVGWASATHLAVAPADGNILLYMTDPDELVQLVRESLTRGFTPAECDRFNFGEACPTLDELRAGN